MVLNKNDTLLVYHSFAVYKQKCEPIELPNIYFHGTNRSGDKYKWQPLNPLRPMHSKQGLPFPSTLKKNKGVSPDLNAEGRNMVLLTTSNPTIPDAQSLTRLWTLNIKRSGVTSPRLASRYQPLISSTARHFKFKQIPNAMFWK